MVSDFFKVLAALVGVYICSDEDTLNQTKMDVARIMVRTKQSNVLTIIVNIQIRNINFSIKVIEDSYGPMKIMLSKNQTEVEESEDSEINSVRN